MDKETLIKCSTCKVNKKPEDFYLNSSPRHKKRLGRCYDCKECRKKDREKQETKELRKKSRERFRFINPEEALRQRRDANLRLNYGITNDDYDRILLSQGGGCAICGSKQPGGRHGQRFHVDHCHRTGKVRGLLCHKCNIGLGSFNDDYCIVYKAGEYIAMHLEDQEKEGDSTSS